MSKQIYAIAWSNSLRLESQGEFCFNSYEEVCQCIKGQNKADRNFFSYWVVSRDMSVDDCVQIALSKKQITWN